MCPVPPAGRHWHRRRTIILPGTDHFPERKMRASLPVELIRDNRRTGKEGIIF
jgi:hypothetical protein